MADLDAIRGMPLTKIEIRPNRVRREPRPVIYKPVLEEIFHDETLVPNEQYGFDTLALSNDLQLFRGPKQMMLQELKNNLNYYKAKIKLLLQPKKIMLA